MKRYFTILSVLLATTAAMAQTVPGDTINRTVLVESTYNPIVTNAVKRNFIPEEVEPSINRTAIVYADKAMPITRLLHKALPTEKVAIEQGKSLPGYLRLGYGNSNNLDGLAAYHLQFGGKHSLSLNADVTGWNGNLKTQDGDWWYSNLYRSEGDARYRFTYDQGELGAGITAGYSAFNYLTIGNLSSYLGLTDLQHASRVGGNIYAKGLIAERYHYNVSTAYTHSGQQAYLGDVAPHSEGHFHTEATVSTSFDKYGTASMSLYDDFLSYSPESAFETMHYLTFTPQWSIDYKRYHFVAGVNLDLSSNSYARIKASPACSITYTSEKNFNASLLLDGGHRLPTYSYLESLSPYWMRSPELQSSYTYLNALLTGNMRIAEGLHLMVNGGYRVTGSAIFETVAEEAYIRYTSFENRNAQLLHATTKLSYDYKQQLSCFAQATYNHWMVESGRSVLARTPQLDAQAGVRTTIFGSLSAHSDLRYILFTATAPQERETSIIDWGLGLRYALNTHWAFYLDGHNLLNHRHQLYTGYPAQGIHVLAGAAFKF